MKSVFFGTLTFLALLSPLTANAKHNFPKSPRETSCIDCHTDALAKKNVHPAAEMDCQSCHTEHDANFKTKLQANSVNELCFNCHDKKPLLEDCAKPYGLGCGHPVLNHPVEGKRDPVFPRIPFTCVSCHNPHSSDNAALFRYDVSQAKTPYMGANCAVCHWSIYSNKPTPPAPSWGALQPFDEKLPVESVFPHKPFLGVIRSK